MKGLLIAGTVITNKEQAKSLIRSLNNYFAEDISVEMALAIDNYMEQIVNAKFLTWEEVEQATF